MPIALVISCLQKHIEKYGKKPTKRSGIIEFADGDYLGSTWSGADSSLRRRGFGGLPDVIEKEFRIKNPRSTSTPVLGPEEILYHTRIFIDQNGRKPHCNDGDIHGVNNLSWKAIDRQLRAGGFSLSQFIAKHLGIKAKNTPPKLSLELIKDWIRQYVKKHGKSPPARTAERVEFAEGELRGISWGTVHSEIKKGRCSLPRGISLRHVADLVIAEMNSAEIE